MAFTGREGEDKDAHGGPLRSYPSVASRRADHPANCRPTPSLAQDNFQGPGEPGTGVEPSVGTAVGAGVRTIPVVRGRDPRR